MSEKDRDSLIVALGNLASEAELGAANIQRPEAQRDRLRERAKIFRLAQEEILSC